MSGVANESRRQEKKRKTKNKLKDFIKSDMKTISVTYMIRKNVLNGDLGLGLYTLNN